LMLQNTIPVTNEPGLMQKIANALIDIVEPFQY
jgi:hypothetical protein